MRRADSDAGKVLAARRPTSYGMRLGVIKLDRVSGPANKVIAPILETTDLGVAGTDALVVGHVVAGGQIARYIDSDCFVVYVYIRSARIEHGVGPGRGSGRCRESQTEDAGRRRQACGIAITRDFCSGADEGFRDLIDHGHRRRSADTGAAAHRHRGGDFVQLGHIVGRNAHGTACVHIARACGRNTARIISNKGPRR